MRRYSFQITKKRYDYLLPIYGNIGSCQLLHKVDRKVDKYYFIGTDEEYKELLHRCEYM